MLGGSGAIRPTWMHLITSVFFVLHILPFIKQDCQIYPNALNGASLLKYEISKLLLFRMIYKKLHLL